MHGEEAKHDRTVSIVTDLQNNHGDRLVLDCPLHLTFSPNAALACKLLNMTVWAVFDIVLRIPQFAAWPYELVYFLQDFGICRQLLEIGARSWALFCVSVN
jgi:hypothetical protein